MITLPKIAVFYTEITSTTKRNEKKAILKKWSSCESVMNLLKVIYDPMITFGVTSNTIKASQEHYGSEIGGNLASLLDQLAKRLVTGNEAQKWCACFVNGCSPEYHQLLYYIFDKNLKIGIDAATINEVFPGFIPVFEVTLAHDINKSSTYIKRLAKEKYFIMRKLDGVRCVTIIKDGSIKCYSRLGNEFTSLDNVKKVLNIPVLNDYVIDGELCVIDSNGLENFKEAVSAIKRKSATMENAHYKIFDILTIDEFNGKKESPSYSERMIRAKNIMMGVNSPIVSILEAVDYSEDNFSQAIQIAAKNGYEGLILRADAPYKIGRSSDLLKVKEFITDEYIIEDFKKTIKLMKGLSGLMEPVECMGSVIIRHKGSPVDVGSGFNDFERIDMWKNQEKYLGRKITVQYQGESVDSNGKPSLRFPTFVDFRDEMI